jgi:hypothetical protein
MNRKKYIEEFSRYEFKYLLDHEMAKAIANDSKKFMKYDGYVHPELQNQYFVRSLYFDNFASSNFFEKVDGIKNRRKYRLRTYSEIFDKSIPIFLEEKGRNNQRTFKKRCVIDAKHYEYFLNKNKVYDLIDLYKDNDLIKRFVYSVYRKDIKPKVIVDYYRMPLVNKYGLDFRLTFDSNISSKKSTTLFPSSGNSERKCHAGYTILEVKFYRSIPPWFHRIIQNYNLSRLSISKFVLGMEVNRVAHDE